MRSPTVFCLAAATCLVAGCVQPLVAPKPVTLQSSENTVRDWHDVAHVIAAEMAFLGLLPTYSLPPPARAMPVFVRVLAPDSAFLHEVAEKLKDDILWAGGTVARAPADAATVVELNVDVVQWSSGPRPFRLMPNVEAVWKATILADDRIVANLAEPVYIWQGDIPLYAASVSQPLRTRPLRYDP